jgi:hypothetical protein
MMINILNKNDDNDNDNHFNDNDFNDDDDNNDDDVDLLSDGAVLGVVGTASLHETALSAGLYLDPR